VGRIPDRTRRLFAVFALNSDQKNQIIACVC
jgi:hypothetical protein